MKLEINCTRADADYAQITKCRVTLNVASNAISETSKIFALAGNETRLKILFLLNLEKELCPCDFADILEMSVPAISQHLRKMKDLNLISTRRDGQTIFYSISKESEAFLTTILSNIESERKIA